MGRLLNKKSALKADTGPGIIFITNGTILFPYIAK